MALSHPGDMVLLQSSMISGSYNCFTFSSTVVPKPWERVRYLLCDWALHGYLVSVCAVTNLSPLHRETFLKRSESCINLWSESCKFRNQIGMMSILHNNSSRFTPWAWELNNHWFLARFRNVFPHVERAFVFFYSWTILAPLNLFIHSSFS